MLWAGHLPPGHSALLPSESLGLQWALEQISGSYGG